MSDELQKSGNLTGFYIAQESSLKVLPTTPVWYEQEPNSYADFGGNFAVTTRRPITGDRQHLKGEVSDNNPTGGFNQDLTPNNLTRLMQGFLFADAHEKASTKPLNTTQVPLTLVDAGTDQYRATGGLTVFKVGHIVLAEGFTLSANNRVAVVSTVSGTAITVNASLADESSPPAAAALHAVGFQFGAGVMTMTVFADRIELDTSTGDLTTLGLLPGEWIGVGGDTTVTRFADSGDGAPFYARIASIAPLKLVIDKTTGTQVTNNGAGKTIQIFFGTVIRNEQDPSLIKLRSYTLERQYGFFGNAQADYVAGAVPNQMTLTIPQPGADAKVTVDIAFIGCQTYERDESEGVLAGTRIESLNEACYTPGHSVYQNKFTVIDPTTLNPTALVGYNSDMNIVINNNTAGNKAIEAFGNSTVNVGEFGVSGQANSYWTSVEATREVRKGSNVEWHLILTKKNAATIFDIASLGFGNGRANVEANAPIRLPLDIAAGKGKYGYTLSVSFMRYIPTVLMAVAQQ